MKRCIAILLVAVFAFSLTACGAQEEAKPSETNAPVHNESDIPTTSESDVPTTEGTDTAGYGNYSEEDAVFQIEVYDWENDGISGATTAAVRDYNEYCADAGVSREDFMEIRNFSNSTENDVDENGKKIAYGKRFYYPLFRGPDGQRVHSAAADCRLRRHGIRLSPGGKVPQVELRRWHRRGYPQGRDAGLRAAVHGN